MQVEYRDPEMSSCPERIQPFVKEYNLTLGVHYEVHAMCLSLRVVAYLLIDDLDVPIWVPAWLFTVSDTTKPEDWICNAMLDMPELVIGPAFIAENQDAYSKMVMMDPTQVSRLRERIACSGSGK